jgi:hypothetical protein
VKMAYYKHDHSEPTEEMIEESNKMNVLWTTCMKCSAGIPSLSFHAYLFYFSFFAVVMKMQIDKK